MRPSQQHVPKSRSRSRSPVNTERPVASYPRIDPRTADVARNNDVRTDARNEGRNDRYQKQDSFGGNADVGHYSGVNRYRNNESVS